MWERTIVIIITKRKNTSGSGRRPETIRRVAAIQIPNIASDVHVYLIIALPTYIQTWTVEANSKTNVLI